MAVEQQRYLEKTGGLSRENLHSLGILGIPFLRQGEDFSVSDLAREKLTDKVGSFDRQREKKQLISNIVFLEESGEWVNGSWVVDIDNFDREILAVLGEPKTASMRFLDVDEQVAELMGSSKMVEIGFNVGGGEIVFKRILLPESYTQMVDEFLGEPLIFAGTKMPDVFADAWRLLNVGAVDVEWDKRVMDGLLGNDRDMSKRIEYWLENGEKYLNWGGEKMWAGLLSDKRDIDRYLAEESNLATLKAGEYLVTKYSHGDGGAISAGTAGEMEILTEPKVVADVQMVGEDGKIYQAAVEGGEREIAGLVQKLVAEMLPVVVRQEIFREFVAIEREVWPMEWELAEMEVGLAEIEVEDGKIQQKYVVTEVGEGMVMDWQWNMTVAKWSEIETVWTQSNVNYSGEEVTEEMGESDDVADEADVDEGGGDEPSDDWWPDDSGGGGLVVEQIQAVMPRASVIQEIQEYSVVVEEEKPTRMESENEMTTLTQIQAVMPRASVIQEIQEKTTRWEEVSEATNMTQVQSEAVAQERVVTQTKIPVWEMDVQPAEIPVWDVSMVVEAGDWRLAIPTLKAEELVTDWAEMAFNVGKWGEFDQLNYWNWAILTMQFAIANTSLEQLGDGVDMEEVKILVDRGSGPQW